MAEDILSIKKYFQKGTFEIPSFQRGFKWGVRPTEGKSSVEFFCDSLKDAFIRKDNGYFIEAVTVVEKEKGLFILVDGQQRTTTLLLIFIALRDFDFASSIKLDYKIRADSNEYLQLLIKNNGQIIENDEIQDIYYFNVALNTIREKFDTDLNIESFIDYIKNNVKLLFNIIPEDKALTTFISLNGLKAIMKNEELIKSDLLIESSRPNNEKSKDKTDCESQLEKIGFEWKINEDRGRLARNWDKWLYWWNQKEVTEFFGIRKSTHPLYYLLVTFWNINKNKEEVKIFDFDNFRTEFISTSKEAKNSFEGLRKLQKTFEDIYNNIESYNFLGLILKTSSSKEDALLYFLNQKNENKISYEEYAKWSLVNATHIEIINNINDKDDNILVKEKKALETIDLISETNIYEDKNLEGKSDGRKEYAFRFLLLLNLFEDNKLSRKFDFSIWKNRSLEHIFPKSKADKLDFSKQGENGSVHCIGNLVLLYGKNNSEFGAKDFEDKKNIYFNTGNGKKLEFKSRNLLHTISVFANSEWKEKHISENQNKTIYTLKDYYGIK